LQNRQAWWRLKELPDWIDIQMNERHVTAAAAIAELDKMKKTVFSGSKLLGTNALKNHIKSLRIEAAKAAALVSTVSCLFVYVYSVLIIILYLAFLPLRYLRHSKQHCCPTPNTT
jgi:Flp pilus assembly protein TadB